MNPAMKALITFFLFLVSIVSCGYRATTDRDSKSRPPLVDSLYLVYADLKRAVADGRPGDFLKLLDTTQALRLQSLVGEHGLRSLRNYFKGRTSRLPDLDTLVFCDFVRYGNYARLCLIGSGTGSAAKHEQKSWTFVLFRRQTEQWKLAAISYFEKERFGLYGSELSYLETELPPRLRFPRLF